MKCRTKFCRKAATKTGRSPWCSGCRTRRFKDKFPLKYFYAKLKYRALERKKEFKLTFAEYEQFCRDTDYDKLKGKTKWSMSINRIDNSRGYEFSNIESISLSLNSRLAFAKMPAWLREEMYAAEKGAAAWGGGNRSFL